VAARRPLRFCFVTTFYPPYNFGGDGIFVYRLAEALAERGHLIDVVHCADAYRLRAAGKPSSKFVHHPNVTVHALRTPTPLLSTLVTHQLGAAGVYARKLEPLLNSGSHDVIHFHNTSLMGAPGIFRLGSGVKLYTTHEYWLICPTHVLFTFGRSACIQKRCVRCQIHALRPPQPWRHTDRLREYAGHIDRFLMPSKFARDRHIMDGLEGDFTVLPHFVPAPVAATASELNPKDDPYFLVVGRLEKIKGVQDLIPIFREYGNARLVVVGVGSYDRELKAAARGTSIEFRGFVHPAEMSSLYRNAIAVIAPSLCYETFFLVGAEAMMHGTPVIARRIGALDEMIVESGGGLTFDTPASLQYAMLCMQRDPALRARLSHNGRAAAEEKWTLEAHLEKYLAIVDELMESRGAGRTP
jgi:glycosyltransferase involved in cell wall biosynthesis